MQAKELSNISISPLVAAPFCVEWSADDHFSIQTEKGVHVFELVPAPTCVSPVFKFSRSFINPSEICPNKSFEEELDSTIWKLEQKELYLLLMEEALTPSVNGAKDSDPRIVGLAWSPWRMMSPCKCLLATVSSAGAVDILFKISRNWFSACDLSTIWLNEVYGESGSGIRKELKDAQPAVLRNYLRRLQATAVAWSELQETGEDYFTYLVTAYRNSEIAVWEVPRLSNSSQDLKPSIVFKKTLEIQAKINVLNWVSIGKKVIIVVGYFDGRVDGLSFDLVDRKFENCAVNKLWEDADRVPVNCVHFWNCPEYGMMVVICKGAFLCAVGISYDGLVEDTQFINTGGYSITGIVKASDSQLMVSTQDGNLFSVTIKDKQLVYDRVQHNLPSSHVQYLGLSSSLNKSLFLNIISPDIMYDHLITREPSTLCIFTIEGKEWDPLELLMNNESKSLTRHWDCLESLRVRVLKSQESSQALTAAPDNLDKLSDYQLRLAMWISVIEEANEKKKFPRRNAEIIGEISDAHPLIFMRLATARLIKLASRENLSIKQRLCASLIRAYIEVYLAGEEEDEDEGASIKNAKQALNSTSQLSSIEPESCDICGEIITELSWKTTTCPRGHTLPRCAVTLLQVSTINYRSCPVCGQILHPCLDEEYDEPLCPYCEVPAMYDSRIFDAKRKPGPSARNLSKRRVASSLKSDGGDKTDENNGKESDSVS